MDIIDNFATRFALEQADAVRTAQSVQVASQYYHQVEQSTWGFPVVASIALIAVLWMVFKCCGPAANALAYPYRRYCAYRRGESMRRSRRKFVENTVADRVTDLLDNLMIEGTFTRPEVQELTGKLGKAFNIPDLVPKVPVRQRVFVLKARLRRKFGDVAKYGNVLVVLAERRKEKVEKAAAVPSMLARLQARRKVSA